MLERSTAGRKLEHVRKLERVRQTRCRQRWAQGKLFNRTQRAESAGRLLFDITYARSPVSQAT
jgi:hypothetical protein